jgi:hypothetical protein
MRGAPRRMRLVWNVLRVVLAELERGVVMFAFET